MRFVIYSIGGIFIPTITVFAAQGETVKDLIKKITDGIVNPLVSFLFVVATVIFFWGIVQYVVGSQGDETKLKQGKQIMIWGIVGLVIMVSAWAIVNGLSNFLTN